jgi:hypothetical protein
MIKALNLSALLVFAVSLAVAQASYPHISFTDLQSGPTTGGLNNQGTIITVYGYGFGASRGTSTITVGGVAAANYLQWSDKKISFQPAATTPTGKVVVNVAGSGSSNSTTFTVRSGHIHFVATTGSDSNGGSITSPWKTIAHAKNSSVAGDVTYVMNGISETGLDNSSASVAIAQGGTAAAPIAIVAYPGATATIGSATGQSYGLRTTTSAGNWVIAGMVLRGGLSAINATNSAGWRVVGNDISCPNGFGTNACADFEGSANVQLYANVIHDSGSTTSTDIKLYKAVSFGAGSNGADVGWNEIARVRACRGIQFYSDTTALSNLNVHDNLIHDTRCDGINFGNVDPAAGAVKAYNNVIYRAGTGPAPGGVEASYAGVKVAGTNSAAVQVQNNTFYDCGGRKNSDSGAVSASAAVSFTDNIVAATTGESYFSASSDISLLSGSNNLFSGAGNAPAFSTASVSADPKFVATTADNYQLQSGSPAIDAGVATSNTRDILQTVRPHGVAFDIGAYEYAGSSGVAQGTLSVSTTSLAFGNVSVGSSSSKTVSIQNPSTVSVSVSQLNTSGTGFAVSGMTAPLVVSPGQTVSFTVTFTPQAASSDSGALQVVSNASNSPESIALSGSGVTVTPTQHFVDLQWNASTSPVAGYNVYRGTQAGGPYTRVNSSAVSALTFTDGTVASGQTYHYVVTAVASDGTESDFSNEIPMVVPTP